MLFTVFLREQWIRALRSSLALALGKHVAESAVSTSSPASPATPCYLPEGKIIGFQFEIYAAMILLLLALLLTLKTSPEEACSSHFTLNVYCHQCQRAQMCCGCSCSGAGKLLDQGGAAGEVGLKHTAGVWGAAGQPKTNHTPLLPIQFLMSCFKIHSHLPANWCFLHHCSLLHK